MIAESRAWPGATDAGKRLAVVNPPRTFDWVRLGFWLGGVTFGIGGCLVGGRMPYQHPVALAFSVIWWGIYVGSLGASLGALLTFLIPSSQRKN